jgi:hypothetical protein
MFPAHLSLGHNYAEFPYFYLKPPAGQCADLATGGSLFFKNLDSFVNKGNYFFFSHLPHPGNNSQPPFHLQLTISATFSSPRASKPMNWPTSPGNS